MSDDNDYIKYIKLFEKLITELESEIRTLKSKRIKL